MSPAWRVDYGLQVLVNQLKARHKGIVVGTIADDKHNPDSDHFPHNGIVRAADPMIGPTFTVGNAQALANALQMHRDRRIKYVIWNRHIMLGHGPDAWKWKPYTGKDPHTGHVHVSVNNDYPEDRSQWNLNAGASTVRKLTYIHMTAFLPLLREGDRDDILPGYNLISRLQRLYGVKADGIWGPKTTSAFGFSSIGSEQQWRNILGLDTQGH